ncbi:MAG: OB-fold nucleic acid binding domain-containing protein, partial [Spongiibacteraceae bacterium]
VKIAGLVTCRQRPGTASGVLFLTLEDETGNSNIVVWPAIQQRHRQQILRGTLLQVSGRLQISSPVNATAVVHIIALKITDHSEQMALRFQSHDFH